MLHIGLAAASQSKWRRSRASVRNPNRRRTNDGDSRGVAVARPWSPGAHPRTVRGFWISAVVRYASAWSNRT
jgi:hypothetical protein